MHISLSGVSVDVADRIRAYAEYRFFSSVARHATLIRSVDIALRRIAGARGGVLCQVHIDLGTSGRVKTQARGAHPSAAIDRAADRAASLLGWRSHRSASS
jgi:ribosome-associated translation inhibitor RaiA